MTNLPINDDLRQHISLSKFAYETISSDLISYQKRGLDTMSGIANQIIRNYFDESFASISRNEENEKSELDSLIRSQHYALGSLEEAAANSMRDLLVKRHRDELSKKMNAYPKNVNIKIRLQKKTVELLERECIDDIMYYSKSLTGYLKALLEDYARQNRYTRERILYKDIIEKVNYAILKAKEYGAGANVLKFTNVTEYGNLEDHPIFVKPYRFTNEEEYDDRVYLLCRAYDPADPHHAYADALMPITLIYDISTATKRYGSAKLSKAEKKSLEEYINNLSLYTFDEDQKKVVVSLTKYGLNRYYHINTKDRPYTPIEKIRISGNRRYIAEFECTYSQALEYFRPFGAHALIIEPRDFADVILENSEETARAYAYNKDKHSKPAPNKDVDADIMRLKEAKKDGSDKEVWNELIGKYYELLFDADDVEAEFLFYQKASELGYASADRMLATLYFENEFFISDYKKAAYYYEKVFSDLEDFEKANYASLILNNLCEGHAPKEGQAILDDIKNSTHKSPIEYKTKEGYTFYSQPYEKGYQPEVLWEEIDDSEE